MTHLTVRRSPVRQLLVLLAGVLLVLAALDVVWWHRIATPPETNEESGEITTTGRSQQRTDYLWGSMLLPVGAGLILFAGASLVARRPVAEVRDDGLGLRVGSFRRMVDFPWSDVAWLHTASEVEEDEAVPPRVLLVHVTDPSGYPAAPWGAEWDGSTLVADADSWSVRPEEVVVHATLALDAWRRTNADVVAGDVDHEEIV